MSPAGSASHTKIYKNILKERDTVNKGKKENIKKSISGKKEIRRENGCMDMAK
jgi:hypothetical protein